MADLLDVLTLAEAKETLRIETVDTTDDVLLARYVTTVSRNLDKAIGPVVARAVTGETHDGCRGAIILRHRPIMAVGSLVEYTGTAPTTLTQMTVTSHPADGYRLEPYDPTPGLYSGIVVRTFTGRTGRFPYGSGNVVCTYTAGRAASTTSVDARYKHAAAICLENLWRDRQQTTGQFDEYNVPIANFPTFALPRAAAELLSDELGQDEPWGF